MHLELSQDVLNVCLDGAGADEQLVADRLVAHSLAQEGEDLPLAMRQLPEPVLGFTPLVPLGDRGLDQREKLPWVHDRFPTSGRLHSGQHLPERLGLVDDAEGARLHRLEKQLLAAFGGQDDDDGLGRDLLDSPGRLDAVRPSLQVVSDQHRVGMQPLTRRDGVVAIVERSRCERQRSEGAHGDRERVGQEALVVTNEERYLIRVGFGRHRHFQGSPVGLIQSHYTLVAYRHTDGPARAASIPR
jgi:hypothetical protein